MILVRLLTLYRENYAVHEYESKIQSQVLNMEAKMTIRFYLAISFLLIPAFALAQQANVNLDYNPQKNTENLIPFSAPLNSPDVRDDRTVTFRVKAPEARTVSLAGGAILTGAGQEDPVAL